MWSKHFESLFSDLQKLENTLVVKLGAFCAFTKLPKNMIP